MLHCNRFCLHQLCSDDAPFSKLKVTVANSLKALLARQQKQKEAEDKVKVTVEEGTVYSVSCGWL